MCGACCTQGQHPCVLGVASRWLDSPPGHVCMHALDMYPLLPCTGTTSCQTRLLPSCGWWPAARRRCGTCASTSTTSMGSSGHERPQRRNSCGAHRRPRTTRRQRCHGWQCIAVACWTSVCKQGPCRRQMTREQARASSSAGCVMCVHLRMLALTAGDHDCTKET